MKRTMLSCLGLSALLAGWWLTSANQDALGPLIADDVAITEAQPQPQPMSAEPVATADNAKALTVEEKIPLALSESFTLLASAYAAELAMPPYSRPVTLDDNQLLNPNQYLVQTVPLQGGASAAIVLEKYRFSYPESVTVSLDVSGLAVSDVSVQLQHELSGQVTATEQMQSSQQGYSVTLEPAEDWHGAFEVQVSFSANGTTQVLKTGIEYYNPVATIVGIADSLGVGSDMQIPVQLEVKQAGYYRLRAVLYTEQLQPLALLTATEQLGRGSAKLTLRAFKAVLRNNSGPYVLGSLLLEKRPAVPGELSQYGDSKQPQYPLEAFALSQLSDEPWQPDEQELQRLQFLKQMAVNP